MGELDDAMSAYIAATYPHQGRPNRDACAKLHSKIIWSAWALAEGGESKLRDRYFLKRSSLPTEFTLRSDELRSYQTGNRTLSPDKQDALIKDHPALAPVFRWPFSLFCQKSKSLQSVVKYIAPEIKEHGLFWGVAFDEDDDYENDLFFSPNGVGSAGLVKLYERGDTDGFFMLVAIYRAYYLKRLPDSQWITAHYLIRALPGICREPCTRPYANEIIAMTKSLLMRLPHTSRKIKINDALLWQNINAEIYEPCKSKRLLAAQNGQIIDEPAEPIVPLTYRRCQPNQVPGIYGNAMEYI